MKSARHCWQFLFAPIFTRSVCNLRTNKKLDRETRITPTGGGAKSLTHLARPCVGVYPRISLCLEALGLPNASQSFFNSLPLIPRVNLWNGNVHFLFTDPYRKLLLWHDVELFDNVLSNLWNFAR